MVNCVCMDVTWCTLAVLWVYIECLIVATPYDRLCMCACVMVYVGRVLVCTFRCLIVPTPYCRLCVYGCVMVNLGCVTSVRWMRYGVATISRLPKNMVSFEKEPYKRYYMLQKRPTFFRSLPIIPTPYLDSEYK